MEPDVAYSRQRPGRYVVTVGDHPIGVVERREGIGRGYSDSKRYPGRTVVWEAVVDEAAVPDLEFYDRCVLSKAIKGRKTSREAATTDLLHAYQVAGLPLPVEDD